MMRSVNMDLTRATLPNTQWLQHPSRTYYSHTCNNLPSLLQHPKNGRPHLASRARRLALSPLPPRTPSIKKLPSTKQTTHTASENLHLTAPGRCPSRHNSRHLALPPRHAQNPPAVLNRLLGLRRFPRNLQWHRQRSRRIRAGRGIILRHLRGREEAVR
jgi:hypothetical protein